MYPFYIQHLWNSVVKHRLFLMGILWIFISFLLSASVFLPHLTATAPTQLSAPVADTSQPVQLTTARISGTPTHISFPERAISVDIIPGYYNAKANSWTLSSDKAQFATVTSEPNNQSGNTFIYGHNNRHVFTGLMNAQVGDTAVITTTNGHTFTYTLRDIHDTDPTDLSYMADHASPILTVQTCSGVWYEHRRMFTFDLTVVDTDANM